MVQLALTLFGGFDATLEGVPVTAFDSNKVRALLAYLAVESGRPHRRESLATLLWPGYPDRSARTNLRNALANLRTAIGDREAGPPFLLITRETLQFNRGSDHWLDVAVLEDALSSAERVPADKLAEAADLYTGDFLAGFTLEDAVGFDDWASVTGERLRRQALELLGTLVDRLEAAGEANRALAYARRRVALEPWLEAAQRQLIRLLAATGQRSAALRQYRSCVRILEEELGAAPSAAASPLYEEIKATGADPAGAEAPQVAVTVPRASTPQLPAFLDNAAAPVVSERPVFVGRAAELARLAGYLDAAIDGQGQVAFVVGGPGRGKSSLMRAFAELAMAAHPDLLVVSGACNAYSGVGDAYLPFREALTMLTGDVETRWRAGRVSREHAQRLWSALRVIFPALVAHGPYVIDSFVSGSKVMSRAAQAGLGDADWMAELRMLSNRTVVSGLEQQALFQQVTNTLQAVAVERPLVLILDDLQWIDQGSIGLLFHLGRRLAGCRILILGAYRPEQVTAGRTAGSADEPHSLAPILDELKRQFGDVWIDLRRADETEGEGFVNALVDSEENVLGERFRQQLFARTRGYPLFTVELLRTMQERGDLIRDREGLWTEGARLEWDTLPARVEAVIEDRLSRLTAQQRDLLTAASVEGETFTAQVIAEVQGLSERVVLRTLSQGLGEQHRLVRETQEVLVNGHFLTQFAFVHALFQEHLYRELSGGERRLLHGEVAEALESLYGEQSAQIAVRLAHYYSQAGKTEKAVEFAVRAGDRARLAYASDEAMTHYSHALALLGPSETDSAAVGWRLSALSGLGKLCHHISRFTESEGYLREAIALGRRMALDPQELALLYHWLGETLFWQGRYEERVRIGEEGLVLLGDDTESVGAALMNQLVAWASDYLGDWTRCAELTLRMARFLEDLPYVEELVPAYAHIILLCGLNKDAKGVLKWVAVLEEKATQYGDLAGLTAARRGAAGHLEETGNLHVALEVRQKQLGITARTGDVKHESWGWQNVAWLYWSMGDVGNAERCAEKFLKLARTVGYARDIADGLSMVGEVDLCQRLWSTAIECFRDALPLYEAADFRKGLAMAHCSLGRAYLGSGQRAQAKRSFCEGIQALPEAQNERDPAFLRSLLSSLLTGLEAAHSDAAAYADWCERFRAREPGSETWGRALQLCLVPVAGPAVVGPLLFADDFTGLSSSWLWSDPSGDCGYQTGRGLEIRAANGRVLWTLNLSAPRLTRHVPSGAGWLIVQVTCESVLADRPAIGGLLLWRDKRDYLWLEVGRFGKRDVAFGGCLDNEDLVFGRGLLPEGPEPGWAMGEPVTLRLELTGDRIDAFCSLDGDAWYSVGHTTFPIDDTVQVGVHAIGRIDRTIYHGAYSEGTAIRFREFRMWGTQEAESEQGFADATPDALPDLHQEEV